MKKKADILISVAFILLGGIVSFAHLPLGAPGFSIVFLGMIVSPGYLLLRLLIDDPLDPWEIYPLSFVIGFSIFSVAGIPLFFARAPLWAAYLPPAILGVIFAAILYIKNISVEFERGWMKESYRIGLVFAGVMFLVFVISWLLGSFRGWAVEEDYYTYITFVRRFTERGYIDNFQLSYPNEGHDPIHSYNVWAMMWAVLSNAVKIDPIQLYIKSAILTVPAAALAFYALSKKIFDRASGMAATICYVIYHFIAMGFILIGRSSFYNDDPGMMIFFPVAISLVLRFLESGKKGMLIAALLACAGTMLVHPLWGVFAAGGLTLAAIAAQASNLQNRAGKMPAVQSAWKWTLRTGWLILLLPDVWVLYRILFFDVSDYYVGMGWESWPQFALLLGPPAIIFAVWIVTIIRKNIDQAKRGASLVISAVLVAAPFAILRISESRATRPEEFDLLRGYNYYLTGKLYVLHPDRFSYTAPDMDFFPWILLIFIALPYMIFLYKRKTRLTLFAIMAVVVIPIIAFHPYLAWIFSKAMHVAYLRRALRFSALFGAVIIGAGAWELSQKAGKWAAAVLIAVAISTAWLAGLYPVEPPCFRGALGKAFFVMFHSPSDGLFWQTNHEAHKMNNITWDTEKFSKLLEIIPQRETVLSDAFTSYRITAYKDIYVMARLKPSTGAMDQFDRERDSSAMLMAEGNMQLVCDMLRRYKSRWILLNIEPSYVLERYVGREWERILFWHPATVAAIIEDEKDFKQAAIDKPWILMEAKPACAPWPPRTKE